MDLIQNINFIVLTAFFAPLVASLFAGSLAFSSKKLIAGILPSALLILSFISSLYVGYYVLNHGIISISLTEWISMGNFTSSYGFLIDSVTATMMIVVTLVSSVVFVYSIGYMEHDISFNRFFSYLGAFVFSMLFLVMSDNFLGLFVGWEGVGLCSYLLIGFWYERKSANFASMEAFIMNRIADLGMLLGIFLIAWLFGSLKYDVVFSYFALGPEGMDSELKTLISVMAILLFIGAMGKSAQFPLHTWLADAMEGPTPVSALIHAATMVTAGVYLVIRANPIFSSVPEIGYYIAFLGAFVAVFASSMALVHRDLKRIIAYSTLSQLGYMFVAAGLGAYWIALLHLALHAFFKALLFLGAGNVMHAMNDKLDITKMGGLAMPLRKTASLMIIASIALAGIYPFAGFFSKDKILDVTFSTGHFGLWLALLVGAMMTAFYSTRLLMLVFFTPKRHSEHPHESKMYMLIPMGILAVLSIVAGYVDKYFEAEMDKVLPSFSVHANIYLILLTTFVVLASIFFGIYAYKKQIFSQKLENTFLYKLLFNQFYIPKLYEKIFMIPYAKISTFLWEQIELRIIDAIVDGIAKVLHSSGGYMSPLQSGNLTQSLRLMGLGLLILILIIIC